MRVSFDDILDSVELVNEARTAKSFEANARLNSAYENMLKALRRGYNLAGSTAKNRTIQIMLDTLYDESIDGGDVDAGVSEEVIKKRMDEIYYKWYNTTKWIDEAGAEDEIVPDNKIRKAVGKLRSYLTYKYMGPPVRYFRMHDGSTTKTSDKRNDAARVEQTLKAFIADNPVKDDSEIFNIGDEAKSVVEKTAKLGQAAVGAEAYQNTEIGRLYEVIANIQSSSRVKGVEKISQEESGTSRLNLQQLASIVTPRILRPYNVLHMKMLRNYIKVDPNDTSGRSEAPKYVDRIISAIDGTLEDKKDLSPENVKSSPPGKMSEEEALLRTKESTIMDLKKSYENLGGDGDMTPDQFEKTISNIVHNPKMPESLRTYMTNLYDTVEYLAHDYEEAGKFKGTNSYDGFVPALINKVLADATDDDKRAFDDYYAQVYAPANKRKLLKINKQLINLAADAALTKHSNVADYPSMNTRSMTNKADMIAEYDKVNKHIQRLGAELKGADPELRKSISAELDTLLRHRDSVEDKLTYAGASKEIQESSVMDYMCEQVITDSRTHTIGEFKDRIVKKTMNYSEWMANH